MKINDMLKAARKIDARLAEEAAKAGGQPAKPAKKTPAKPAKKDD